MKGVLLFVIIFAHLFVVHGRDFQAGMAFGGDVASIPFNSTGAVQSLQNIKATGADWVCIVFSWFQDTINSTVIYPLNGVSPTYSEVTAIINHATAMGFKVVLKPHVDTKDGVWRAWIGTYFTEQDWITWFNSYEGFYLTYAKLAQELGVSVFSVGVEMVTASQHAGNFIQIVKDVRQVFSGTVTYAANWGTKLQSVLPPKTENMPMNWGGEIDQITWINVLDVIGIDAYYYLVDEQNPTLDDLTQAWSPIVAHIRNISQYWNKSVILTEIGYRSIEGAAVHPGWWNISAVSNLTQQAVCYQAVFESFMNEDWWEGIHWWMWSTNPNAGGEGDTDYTPQNKPETVQILQSYYGKMKARSKS